MGFEIFKSSIGHFIASNVYKLIKPFWSLIGGRVGNKVDVIGFYDFVLTEDKGRVVAPKTGNNKLINWLIPDFGKGSGGHLNIFRYIKKLEERGYENNICIIGAHHHSSPEDAKAKIASYFFPLNANVVFGTENLPFAFYSFATGWTTAYALKGFGNTVHKLYFVQDFEPYFYAHGSEYDFAEETYRFGFIGVCAGQWLADTLKENYDMKTFSLGFSYDRELYLPSERREPHIKRVFCYCRPPTVRRGLETALLALNLVGKELPGVKFIFAGWDMSGYEFEHEHLNAGVLSLEELPDLYSQCDVALVLSFTNLSLLPLELMSCGCAVVSNSGANVEWLLNESNSVITSASPKNLADVIVNLLKDEQRREELINNAKVFASSTCWDSEAEKLVDALEGLQ